MRNDMRTIFQRSAKNLISSFIKSTMIIMTLRAKGRLQRNYLKHIAEKLEVKHTSLLKYTLFIIFKLKKPANKHFD